MREETRKRCGERGGIEELGDDKRSWKEVVDDVVAASAVAAVTLDSNLVVDFVRTSAGRANDRIRRRMVRIVDVVDVVAVLVMPIDYLASCEVLLACPSPIVVDSAVRVATG